MNKTNLESSGSGIAKKRRSRTTYAMLFVEGYYEEKRFRG